MKIKKILVSQPKPSSEKSPYYDIAEKYGVTYQAVSKWENGKNIPDISLLKQICDDYNININDLLEGKNSENNQSKKVNKKFFS